MRYPRPVTPLLCLAMVCLKASLGPFTAAVASGVPNATVRGVALVAARAPLAQTPHQIATKDERLTVARQAEQLNLP